MEGRIASLKAFAWGGVWFHSAWLPACNRHPTVRSAISHALQTSGKSAAVLGSSIGFEAYFIALTYGLPTVGVELLCGLVDLSERVRRAHRIASDAVRFECADALMWEPFWTLPSYTWTTQRGMPRRSRGWPSDSGVSCRRARSSSTMAGKLHTGRCAVCASYSRCQWRPRGAIAMRSSCMLLLVHDPHDHDHDHMTTWP